jgi:hypothetical protein
VTTEDWEDRILLVAGVIVILALATAPWWLPAG